MAYDKTNSGALFKNKKKEKDTHPDYTGNINADGVEYWLSAWVKEKDGTKYFSLSIKQKETKSEKNNTSNRKAIDFEDDIPFN